MVRAVLGFVVGGILWMPVFFALTFAVAFVWPAYAAHGRTWFETGVFTPVARFGNLGRNVIIGPGFHNMDFSVLKNIKLSERMRLQCRAEVFDLFNHPSFGNPVNTLASPLFGRSTQTLASSLGSGGANGGLNPLYQIGGPRSVQLALKLQF